MINPVKWSLARQAGGPAWLVLPALLMLVLPCSLLASGERRFGTPEEAVKSLVTAAEAGDTNAIRGIFGPEGHELVSPDVVQASEERQQFIKRLTEKTEIVHRSDAKVEIQIGADGWPFPIPLVMEGTQWFFDIKAGSEEILNRRIGRNEIGAIQVCHAYVQAQREFAMVDRDGDDVVEYARLLRSTPGKHDGLYWPATDGWEMSPLGPLISEARAEGYRGRSKTKALADDQSAPYHGYYFKILTRQGQHAPGGKYKYIINGHMVGGFAMVAWPAEWGNSGVMTLMVNQTGRVYEKNLGPNTAGIASGILSFDPDSTWKPTEGQ